MASNRKGIYKLVTRPVVEETKEATHNLIPVHCITPFCSDALVSPLNLYPPWSIPYLVSTDEATRSFAGARFGSFKAIDRTGSVGTERSRVWFFQFALCGPLLLQVINAQCILVVFLALESSHPELILSSIWQCHPAQHYRAENKQFNKELLTSKEFLTSTTAQLFSAYWILLA